jgi:DNA-binding transcriptional LysR family regulator
MDLKTLKFFLSAYEERSMTRAAEKNHVVQSAVSMQIRALEKELGAPLFERKARGVVPTIAGRRFYELARSISRDVAAAVREINDMSDASTLRGPLRIGLPPTICRGFVGRTIASFIEVNPLVDLTIIEAYSPQLIEHLRNDQLDVILSTMPEDAANLSHRRSFRDHCVLVTRKPLDQPPGTPCDLFAASGLKLILPSPRHYLGSRFQRYITLGQICPEKTMTVDGLNAAIDCLAETDWAAVALSTAMFHEQKRLGLYLYPISQPAVHVDHFILHDSARPLSKSAFRFFEMLESALLEWRSSTRSA